MNEESKDTAANDATPSPSSRATETETSTGPPAGGGTSGRGAGTSANNDATNGGAAPAGGSGERGADDAGAGGQGNGGGAVGPDGAPRKRRRRGKRGGKRHRKPGTASAAAGADAEQGGTTPEDASVAGAKAPPRPRAPRAPKEGGDPPGEGSNAKDADAKDADAKGRGDAGPGSPRATSSGPRQPAARGRSGSGTGDAEASSGSADATDGAPGATDGAATGEGAEGDGTGAPRKRRRRGGRGRGGAKKTAAAPAAEDKRPAKSSARPAAKKDAAAGGSTRLAARAQRRQQRGKRPRRKLSESEARALRGNDLVMLVHEHEDRTQMAILEEGTLIEHYVARKGQRTTMAGNVYLGKVQNVLPGMEAAFVDFGRGRNGVLYAGEVNYSKEDLEGDQAPRIEHVLKNGQKLMVQVTKDPIGNKGARLTTQVSLAGRYMVLAPEQQVTGISRRLAESERTRLRQFLKEMRPSGHGVIVRTAADGASREALERDLKHLLSTWEKIQKSSKRAKAPSQLYSEPDLVTRVIRDEFSDDFQKVVVDTRDTYDSIKEYLESSAPDLLPKLELHEGALPLFEEWRVSEQLHKALERKVWLPSGGSLVIDRTEALTVIDVNTGKFTGKGSTLEETVFANNLEAAEEVARQLRLRDIGGIIVIDFIDMIDPKNQKELLRTLKKALSKDRTRSQVFEVSNLGLVEMTRKKVSEGLLDAFSEPCPNCEGRGIVLTHDID